MHYEIPWWERTRVFGPQSRYCADDHTLAGGLRPRRRRVLHEQEFRRRESAGPQMLHRSGPSGATSS